MQVSDLLDYSEPSSRAFLFEDLLLLVVPTATICSSKGMIPLETIKRDITTLGIIAKSLVISMGTNQTGKRFYQVKVKSPDTTSIKELGRLMEPLQMQAFRKTYGKILELTIAEVSIEAIASLTQYYDQPLRCFTFGDFQLVPTIEEFEEILGCPLGGRKPYLSSGCLPSLSRIATVVKDSARGLDRIKQTRNGIAGLPQKYLEDKARGMANQGDWVPFMDVLALLIFGVVLFPNVDGLVDLAAIDAFLAYHHSKESPVVAVLADLFDTFDRRCEKSSARIICCLPALCVWLVSHLFQQDTRHPCPLLSHRSCTEKRRMDWDQLLAGIGGRTISWFPRWKEGKEGVLFSCGRYPNIPLVGTRGCINYNPTLAIRQLGYPMRGAPTEGSMSPFLVRDLGAQNSKTIQRIHKAWETPLRKDQELRGIRNGIIGGYHEWLKVHIRGLDWLAKLKVVSKENFEAPEEDEEELIACSRSKRSLPQRLCETETNMLAIIAKYQEELGLATAHEHRIADETMGDQEETQEQMKADMSALKEQMVSMMEAMLGMKQLMEKNAATAAAVSSAAEADPTLLATTHHPPSNIVGRGRDTLGHDGSPHLGYNRAAYPYGLPPNYSPPILQEDAGHIASPVHEKEPPQQPDEVHKDPQDYAQRDVEFYPPIPEGPAPGTLPQPNIAASPILVGYMPSSFADLVFAGERIEVGLKRGKFDYVSSTNVNAKRIGATGAKRKEGDAHAVSSTPAWVKPQQTPHGTHQYAQHHPSFSAHAGNASSSTPVQPKAPTQREAPQVPTPNTTRPAGNSNTTRNFPPRPLPEFTPLPMTYEDLLPSLIANHLAVVTPGRVLEPPFPKWYDPNATCKYHGGVPGHSVEKCLALKYKVQHLMDAGWLTFQEDRPNVRTNPLANHEGGAVNAVESDRPHRSKPLRDVATPRRFIFEALQKGGVIPHSGCKEDSCLLHSGEMHDMETCLEVEELLQRMIDQGRLEVGIEGKEEQHICMQSTEGSGVAKPKPLVIYFTKSAASQKPGHPLMAKPVPFPYQNTVMMARVMLGNGFEPGMGLGKNNGGITSLINTQGNRGKYGLGYKPTQADMKRSIAGRKNNGQSSRWRQEGEGSPPCHISRSFISAGSRDKGQAFAICEDDIPSTLDLVRPCSPDFQLGNWRVEERPGIYATSIIDDHGFEAFSPHGQDHLGLPSGVKTKHERQKPIKVLKDERKRGWGHDRPIVALLCAKQAGNVAARQPQMVPRKLASKRSRKDKAAEGTSSAPEYDSHRFRSAVHQQRFEAIKGWSFLQERRVQLRDDKYTDFQEEIGRRRWAPLVTPMAKFDPEIVLEFYANAWPTEEGVRDMRSWVRGQWIPFDADAIGQLLGYPLVLEEGQECEYGQRRNRSDGFDEEAIAQLLSTSCPPIIIPTSPCRSMAPTRHLLDPDKSNRALGFPALITGLCQSFGVPVAPTKVIRPPITRVFIEKYCTQRQGQGDAPQAAGAPPPPHQAGQAGAFDMEQYLRHLVRQQAANHRAHVRTHDCLYQMSLSMQSQGFASFSCPTPDQFRAEVAWPGDWPEAQAGEAPPEAPGDGEEAHEDEEMADLLDFLGGSGDTEENTETLSSLTSYPELRRSEFLIGGYVGARASLLSTIPPFVAMTQELVARGDTLRLFAPFCHPEAAGPMTSRDQVWSFCTLVSSRGGGPDDTRRYLTVIRTLLSSRGGGPDDKQRPKAAGPMIRGDTLRLFAPFCHPEAAGPMTSRDQVWSFCTLVSSRGGGPDDTRRYLTVIRTLLSSRGGGPDDKQRPKAAGPMIRGDTLRLFAPFCHPEAAGPMTSRDQVWSFCTLVSSRGGRPDDTRRYLTVIRTLLSSRGGGPDDKQRPKEAGPMIRGDTLRLFAPICHPEAAGPMTSRDQVWSFCTLVSSRGGGPDDTRRYLTVIRTLLSSRGGGPDDKQRPKAAGPMIRGDTLRLFAPFCHPEAAGPMIRGDTLRLFAPICHPEAAGPMTSRDQVWSFCTLVSSRGGGPDDTRKYPSGYPYKHSIAICPLGPSGIFLQKAVASGGSNPARLGELGGNHLPYFAINRGGRQEGRDFNRSSTFFIRSSSFFDLQRGSHPQRHPVDPKKSNRALGFPALESHPQRHPVDPEKPNRARGFPALVTGLCSPTGCPFPPARSRHHDIGKDRACKTRRSPTGSWSCQALITGLCQFYGVPVTSRKGISVNTTPELRIFILTGFLRFFRRFSQINVGGDSAHLSSFGKRTREPRLARPQKGTLRHPPFSYGNWGHLSNILFLITHFSLKRQTFLNDKTRPHERLENTVNQMLFFLFELFFLFLF
ncbi:hypothetical protein HKD37_10G028328 [Glycine soja]